MKKAAAHSLVSEFQALKRSLATADHLDRPATPRELKAAEDAGQLLFILTGRISDVIVVELQPFQGCALEPKDFPPTWSAASPARALLFFRCPAGGLPCSDGLLGQCVVIHGDGSAVPLIGIHGWGGFLWMPDHSPKECQLRELPRLLQLALQNAGLKQLPTTITFDAHVLLEDEK